MFRPSLLFAAALLLAACHVTDPESGPTRRHVRITTGAAVPIASGTIGAAGGSLVVPASADTLAGLRVDVPAGAHGSSHPVALSYAPITSTDASDLKLLSPMVIVDNGGAFAAQPMTMRIPVHVPPSMFAMAFAYNETDGSLEGIPIMDQDETGVTLWTFHFAHSAMHEIEFGKSVGGRTSAPTQSRIVIVAEDIAELMGARVDDVNFMPGFDDFAFPNNGSVIKPGGHCAGQSLAMMYYYFSRRMKGEQGLTTRFDNDELFTTHWVWQDDAAAYRYSSMLQGSWPAVVGDEWFERNVEEFGVDDTHRDSMQFMAFKLAMRWTRVPQFVGLLRDGGGHAIVAYGASVWGVRVCDPNFPGDRNRDVSYSGRFVPYRSSPTADAPGREYPFILYLGVSSAMDWREAAELYPSLVDHTAGLERFPSFVIKVRDADTSDFVPITPGWTSRTGKIMVRVTSPNWTVRVDSIFRPDGSRLEMHSDSHGDWFSLPQGRTKIGFYLTALAGSSYEWAGFRWAEVAGLNAPAIPRCSVDLLWTTTLGIANIVYTDSLPEGRRVIFEDEGEPMDICSDNHVNPEWTATGSLSGMTVTAKAYWGGLWGRSLEMTGTNAKRTATMEIGLKQAFGDRKGWVGLQMVVVFPSRGDLATDLQWLQDQRLVGTIRMKYRLQED